MAVGSDFSFKVTHQGQTLERFNRKIRGLKSKILRKVELIGGRIGDHMSLVINQSRSRKSASSHSGGLASAFRDRRMIRASMIGDTIRVGVGNKKILNIEYPYWKLINKGGMVPKPTFGYFGHGNRPNSAYAGTGVGNQLWHRQGDPGAKSNFLMRPKSPIPAMNYIGKTKTWARRNWQTKWKKEIINIIKKR